MTTDSHIPQEKKLIKPETIFKYEAFSAQSLINLKAQYIYFGSPLGFNDPYDCALKPGILPLSAADLNNLWMFLNVKEPKIAENSERNSDSNLQELSSVFKPTAAKVLSENIDNFLKNSGVSCFSENNDNLLMWAHYGGKYKGFCLEFKTNAEPFTKMRKVDYVDEIPKIDAASVWINQDTDSLIRLFCTKSKSWEYEKEWRIIHQKAGTLFTYESDVLTSVYFGPDIDKHSLEIVCLILKGQNPNVKLWQGRRSQEKFEVEFEQIEYMNHLEAKSKGLS